MGGPSRTRWRRGHRSGLMAEPRLSLVVATRGRPEAVERLLGAIRAQDRPPDEVVVIDASADGGTERTVGSADPLPGVELRYVSVPEGERGLTRQRNRGIDEATGEIVAFLDDDTAPEPDYF